MLRWSLPLVLLAGQAMADDWKMRDGDALLAQSDLHDRLSGRVLVFYDDGRSNYQADGKYSYTYGGGGTWYGHWQVGADSVVCVTFVTGVERCDRIVENDGRLVVLTADGQRFPVRP